MNHRHRYTQQMCTCDIIPPYVLESIARTGTETQRSCALQTLALDERIWSQRAMRSQVRPRGLQRAGPPRKRRIIYTAANGTTLPGTLIRSEGHGSTGDLAADEAYDDFGATFDLYWDAYGRNSIDDNGMDLIGTVHYGDHYDNAFWDVTQMVFGDGDGTVFNRFTIAVDVIGHERTHGVTAATAALEYHDQPGALNESFRTSLAHSLSSARSDRQRRKQTG